MDQHGTKNSIITRRASRGWLATTLPGSELAFGATGANEQEARERLETALARARELLESEKTN